MSVETGLALALFGPRSCSIESSNTFIRLSTDGSPENDPSRLLTRNGPVDQMLTSDGTRVKPSPPPGIWNCHFSAVNGSCTVTFPTEGRVL